MYPIFLIILSGLFFSILAVSIKFLSAFIHPIEQAFFRNFLSIFILTPWIFINKFKIPIKKNLKLLLLRSFFGGITMILLFWSYSLIPISQAMAISFSTPLFIYFGSTIFLGEKTSVPMTQLMFLGFSLTLIIIRPDADIQLGSIIAILAAITHAIAGLLVKKLSESESVFTLMLSMVLIMTPMTLIPSLFVWTTPNSFDLYLMLFTIAVIASLGNYLWTKSISLSKLTNIMPFDFTKLIFATFLGFVFLDEKIDTITMICGSGLILCNTMMAKKISMNEKNKGIFPDN